MTDMSKDGTNATSNDLPLEEERKLCLTKGSLFQCLYCGKEFVLNWHTRRYCSEECKLTAYRAKKGVSKLPNPRLDKSRELRWVLQSPKGEIFDFINLREWAKSNYWRFGSDTHWQIVQKAIITLKMRLRTNPQATYKGWLLLASDDVREIIP